MLEGLEPPKNKTVYCKIDQIAATLSESDRKIMMDAIDSPEWGARTLSNSLRSRGVSIADTTITKHRQRACACFRG